MKRESHSVESHICLFACALLRVCHSPFSSTMAPKKVSASLLKATLGTYAKRIPETAADLDACYEEAVKKRRMAESRESDKVRSTRISGTSAAWAYMMDKAGSSVNVSASSSTCASTSDVVQVPPDIVGSGVVAGAAIVASSSGYGVYGDPLHMHAAGAAVRYDADPPRGYPAGAAVPGDADPRLHPAGDADPDDDGDKYKCIVDGSPSSAALHTPIDDHKPIDDQRDDGNKYKCAVDESPSAAALQTPIDDQRDDAKLAGLYSTAARQPPRKDQPEIRNAKRGSAQLAKEAARDDASKAEAFAELELNMYSKSNVVPRASYLRRWVESHHDWFCGTCDPLPLTPMKMMAVAAMFRKGHYRRFPNYMQRIVDEHREQGFAFSEGLQHMRRKCERAVSRGIGPGEQSEDYDLVTVSNLDMDSEPVVENGPVCPKELLIVGGFWVLREIEASAIDLDDVTLERGSRKASIRLTASKTDVEAKGVARTWGCVCSRVKGPCPYCALVVVYDYWKGKGHRTPAPLCSAPLTGDVPRRLRWLRRSSSSWSALGSSWSTRTACASWAATL